MAIVQLEKSQRGVGDIELRNSSGSRKWISGRDYVSSDTLPSGYVKYGVIYGFEKFGAAMLVAFEAAPSGTLWCSTREITLPTKVSDNATSSWGRALSGTAGTNKCMNVARVASLCETGAANTTETTHPQNSVYDSTSGPNTKAMFEANANAVNLYGTYEAYIAQLRPILKSSYSGVFSKRCGKVNTVALATDTSYTFPAAQYCYNYVVDGSGDSVGNWWLPDMYELAVLLSDESYSLHRTNSGVSAFNDYWSSVVAGTYSVWSYRSRGYSIINAGTDGWRSACPVTISE